MKYAPVRTENRCGTNPLPVTHKPDFTPHGQEVRKDTKPDVDEAIEQAWHRLYAKMEQVTPIREGFAGERQAMAIVKSLGEELRTAANALERTAETLKLHPNLKGTERLRLANATIKAARRAREAAESVLG